jgi:hypothetical protein
VSCPDFPIPREELPPSLTAIFRWSRTHKTGSYCHHLSVAGDEDNGHDRDELLRGGVGGGLEGGTRSTSVPTSFCTADGQESGRHVPREWQREDESWETRRTTWTPAPPCQGCQGRLCRGCSGRIHAMKGMEINGGISSTRSMENPFETKVCESELYLPIQTHFPF